MKKPSNAVWTAIILVVLFCAGILILMDETLMVIVGVIALVIWGGYKVVRARKHAEVKQEKIERQREKNRNIYAIDPKDAILYLRPFKTDANEVVSVERDGEKIAKRSGIKKFRNQFDPVRYRGEDYADLESLLCAMLRDKGAPIAIGDPREQELDTTVEDGAARVYATDETWKQKVEYYFQCAKMVIVYVDFTEGVDWEINYAVYKHPEKVVFVPMVYNKRYSLLEKCMPFAETMIFTLPLYLFQKWLLLPDLHRGADYYVRWERAFGFPITDRVSAVKIVDGKPVLYETKNGLFESQMQTIQSAILGYPSKEKKK